jgi:hypothetical protein
MQNKTDTRRSKSCRSSKQQASKAQTKSSTSAKAQVPSFHRQQKRHQHTSLARSLARYFLCSLVTQTTDTALAQTKTDTKQGDDDDDNDDDDDAAAAAVATERNGQHWRARTFPSK